LLEAYGYSLNDDLAGKFEFTYKDGKPFLRVLDAGIKRIAAATTSYRKPVEIEQQPETVEEKEIVVAPSYRLGAVFNFNKKTYPYFTIDVVNGEGNDAGNGFAGKVEKIDLTKYVDTVRYTEQDKQSLALLRKLQESEINKYISRNSPFSGFWENIIHNEEEDLPAETKNLMAEYLLPKLKKLFTNADGVPLAFQLPQGKPFKTSNLQEIKLSGDEARPHFFVSKNGKYSIRCHVKADGLEHELADNESPSPLLFVYNHQVHLWKNNEVVEVVDKFLPAGKMDVTAAEWNKTLHQFILPLTKQYKVDFDKALVQEIKAGDPEVKLFLL
jgi:non-specific serine/threonine protein kinase